MSATERLRALLDSGRVQWMPGMLAVWYVKGGLMECGASRITEDTLGIVEGGLPDLSDPATIDCLLAQLREAWGDTWLHTLCETFADGDVWWVAGADGAGIALHGRTEAEAIVAAFEALP